VIGSGDLKPAPRGRLKPYSAIGIARVPCCRCGAPANQQWQACANGRRYLPVCIECDIAINRMALEFMGFDRVDERIAMYAENLRGSLS
jgi:hypothetical protein